MSETFYGNKTPGSEESAAQDMKAPDSDGGCIRVEPEGPSGASHSGAIATEQDSLVDDNGSGFAAYITGIANGFRPPQQ
jgi:hypothetical protein